MTYFPTTKLLDLSAWLRPAPRDPGVLATLVDRVARDTGHMTALSSRLSLFVNTVLLRPGKFSSVAAPARSVGAALTNSVYGHVILSQLDDDELADILRETDSWMRNAGARNAFDKATTLGNVDQARRRGYLAGPHPTCRGTEIIAYAVKTTPASPYALSVHLPACLSRDGKDDVRQLLESRVRDCSLPKSLRHAQPARAARRPSGRAPDFAARMQDGLAAGRLLAAQRQAR
jgi:DNA-binding IclR family transcriptional regulator